MANTFRVTTYELKDDASGFTGTTFTLSLRQDLAEHYFVLFDGQGAFAGGTSYCGPDIGATRVSKDPFGSGDLGTTTNPDELELTRATGSETWVGTVTVVECLGDHDTTGFRLRTVLVSALTAAQSSLSTVLLAAQEWNDIDQVVPFGGLTGGGAASTLSSSANWHAVAARFLPKVTGSIQSVEISRDLTAGNGAADFCCYLVEWGSEWTVQRASPSGTSGGNGVNSTGEYDTASISSVTRANSWVWGCATTADNGLGDGAHGAVYTLGDGVSQNASETTVALGLEYSDQKDAEIYVLEHSAAAVYYRFGTDNGTGIPTASASGTMTVDAAGGSEAYGSSGSAIDYTEGTRFPIFTNTKLATRSITVPTA
ncbi:MAG: hypothetical protein CMJ94_12535 [Planctomycetes bacterium]|nr:hypothetical protein [Planctomycetota bacterium]